MSGAVKKKARPGRLELSEDGSCLVVHYETLEVAVLPDSQEVVQSSRPGTKRIKLALPQGDGDDEIQAAAQAVVDGCKLLHAARVPEVQRLLAAALERRRQQPAAAAPRAPGEAPDAPVPAKQAATPLPDDSEGDQAPLHREQQRYLQAAAARATRMLAAAAATASLDRLGEYLEELYEEDPATQAAAVAAVAHLCRDPANLGALLAHGSLVQALARLLRETAQRGRAAHRDLCAALLAVFFALSHLPHAQELLAQHQVGSSTLALLEAEVAEAEAAQRREGVALADVGAKLLRREALAPREQRLAGALAAQEAGLYLGLSLLLNQAEDVGVQQKMMRRGLLGLLASLLDRGAPQLLALAATFLRKLSLHADNRAALRESDVVSQLAALVPGDGGPLLASVLRLLHNLSFDEGMRQQMVAAGMIAKAAALLQADTLLPRAAGGEGNCAPELQEPPLRRLVLGLLYQLSLQDKHRSMFLYTDALPLLHAMLAGAPLPLAASSPELAALLTSLAGSMRVAEGLAKCGTLGLLLGLLLEGPAEPPPPGSGHPSAAAAGAGQHEQHRQQGGPACGDELLWRLLRCMAEHDSEQLRARFGPALERIARLLMSGTLPPGAFTEALGCLAVLDIPCYDYAQLLRATQLHVFLSELLAPAGAPSPAAATAEQEGTLLLAVEAVGVLCADAACAEMVVEAGLVDALRLLMLADMEDAGSVLATTTAAARLLAQPPTRDALLGHAELAARFAELLQHPDRGVAHAASVALDAVAAGSEEWAASVRRLKFECHNREWLHIVRAEEQAAAAAAEYDGSQPAFHGQQMPGDGDQPIAAFWGSPGLAMGS